MERQPCVYIFANKRNGTLYVGVTSNLIKEPLINSLKRHLPRCRQAQNTHLLRVNSVFSPVRALHLLA